MEPIKISVVVPSYNQGRYLREALMSLVRQRDPSLEIIVCDGGSTDDSLAIIREFGPKLAHWYSEKDGGQSAAINRGVAAASGQIVSWLNSDDVLADGALARIREAVASHGFESGVFYGDHTKIDEAGGVLGRYRSSKIRSFVVRHYGWYVCQPGTFFDRAMFRRVGGVDEKLQVMMDIDLWWKFERENCRWIYLPVQLALFRKHGESKGASLQSRWRQEQEILAKRYGLKSSGTQAWMARMLHWGMIAPARLMQKWTT